MGSVDPQTHVIAGLKAVVLMFAPYVRGVSWRHMRPDPLCMLSIWLMSLPSLVLVMSLIGHRLPMAGGGMSRAARLPLLWRQSVVETASVLDVEVARLSIFTKWWSVDILRSTMAMVPTFFFIMFSI